MRLVVRRSRVGLIFPPPNWNSHLRVKTKQLHLQILHSLLHTIARAARRSERRRQHSKPKRKTTFLHRRTQETSSEVFSDTRSPSARVGDPRTRFSNITSRRTNASPLWRAAAHHYLPIGDGADHRADPRRTPDTTNIETPHSEDGKQRLAETFAICQLFDE